MFVQGCSIRRVCLKPPHAWQTQLAKANRPANRLFGFLISVFILATKGDRLLFLGSLVAGEVAKPYTTPGFRYP